MANMNFGVNILPKANNTYSLGNSDYKWNIFANTINGTSVSTLLDNIITDIKIGETSILSNGIATIPYANSSTPGLTFAGGMGISISQGHELYIAKASESQIKAGTSQYMPIVPYNQEASVFYGLARAAGDNTQSASSNVVGLYTNDAKFAIQNMLSVAPINNPVFTGNIILGNETVATEKYVDEAFNSEENTIDIETIIDTLAAIQTIEDGADNLPMALTVGIEPVQSGTGDPSPTNVRPISGWTGANVSRTGKNLLDVNATTDGYYNGNGVFISNTSYKTTDYIPVESEVLVTGYIKSGSIYSVWFDANKTKTGSTFSLEESANRLTVPQGAKYLRCSLNSATIAGGNFAVSTGAKYAYTFPSEAGTVYGGTLTVNKDGTGELMVDRASVDMGTMNWTRGNNGGGWVNYLMYAPIESMGKGANIISEVYETVKVSNLNNIANLRIATNTQVAGYVYARDDSYTSAADFKNAMNEKKLIYELANPVTYTLTAEQIKTLKGINNVWADTGNINSVTYSKQTAGLINTQDKVKLNSLATVSLTGNYNDLLNKPDLSQYLTSVPTMTGATSSTAGTSGLAPAPAAGDEDKFLAGDGTYKSGGLPMVILSYGSSTWADFEAAYNNNVIVYCRASSNSNPATGSQTRMAFMAYVNNSTTPTNVEFQYYRSVNPSNKSMSQLSDQVFVYKLDKTSGWSVTTREASIKSIVFDASTGLTGTYNYSTGVLTITTAT